MNWLVPSAIVAAGIASFLPTIADLLRLWMTEPDYSHGILVPPLAIALLYSRRSQLPQPASVSPAWSEYGGGYLLLAAALLLRLAGDLLFIGSFDGWALILWLGGIIWIVAGRAVWIWSLPGLGFLCFMVPLPFRVEVALSLPLQSLATSVSTWLLQSLGQPAVAEGHIIRVGHVRLEVVEACSGLRMFITSMAIGVAFIAFVQRPLWHRIAMTLGIIPIAIAANALRIVVTAMLLSIPAPDSCSHHVAAWLMMPLGAVLFLLWTMYLDRLVIELKPIDFQPAPVGTIVRA